MSDMHDEHEDLFGAYDDERKRAKSDRPSSSVQDFLRRAFENTFESVKDSGAIPKEAFTYLLQQGDKGRRELVKVAAKELGDFLRATDISSEVVKVLTAVQMEMTLSVRFKRNEDGDGVVPDVTVIDKKTTHASSPDAPTTEPAEDDPFA